MIGGALALGLVTSLHCAAMCGPLAAAASGSGAGASARYFLGRLSSYAAVGALLGALGEHALCRLPMGTVQRMALALVAVAALARAVRIWIPRRGELLLQVGTKRPRALAARFWKLVPRGPLAFGLATGVLPCGMLVPAWLLAMAAGGPLAGAGVMLAFGVASSPGLIAAVLGRRLLARLPRRPRLEAVAWVALALWIAARPLIVAVHCM